MYSHAGAEREENRRCARLFNPEDIILVQLQISLGHFVSKYAHPTENNTWFQKGDK